MFARRMRKDSGLKVKNQSPFLGESKQGEKLNRLTKRFYSKIVKYQWIVTTD